MSVHEFDVAWRLLLALGLSSVIGLERELRQKSAGLRTYALVGVGSALFMLVSSYGFASILSTHVTLDPSRVAAQVVSGIGFIGGGLIFVHRADVRGLTTAAGVWTVAAVGMAAGGDLPILATLTTILYLAVSVGYPHVTKLLPTVRGSAQLRITYLDGRGVLRELLGDCAEHGFAVCDLQVENGNNDGAGSVTVRLELRGRGSLAELATDLGAVDGVEAVDRYSGDPGDERADRSTRSATRLRTARGEAARGVARPRDG
ncbi:MAG TPA: MgtC/SapB family protein [Solirubrobacteraceae bacterium]|jgi:putative Mg2+ transporter-C (MgtC) family protein|nr:MgtC/SapB family protein [Solirubrobacteraceae bacterium]